MTQVPRFAAPIIMIFVVVATLSSCTTDRLNSAATTQGKISASISLPAFPSDCRVQEPHAVVKAGDELRSVIIRERSGLNRANARVTRCGDFYQSVRTNFGKKI